MTPWAAWLRRARRRPPPNQDGQTRGQVTRRYTGVLEAYWEQGWEGRVEYALYIEGMGAPFFLANGQRLTIYAQDGSVLWAGVVRLAPRKWRENHNLPSGIWAYEKQAGLSYAQWIAWFVHKPPLRATVEVDEEVIGHEEADEPHRR